MRFGRKIVTGILFSAAFFMAAGCSQGDMSSPEGQFRGCYYHVRQMKSALDSTARVHGNLNDIRSVADVYELTAPDEMAREHLIQKGKMYCEYVKVLVDGESGNYTLSAYPLVAPQCEIIADPTGISPKSLEDCN